MNDIRAKKKNMRRIAILLVLFVCLTGVLPRTAMAAESPDPSRQCSLSLVCTYQLKLLQGMPLRIYRVANGTADTGFSLSGSFATIPVSLAGLTGSGWSTAAASLASYIRPNGIAATASGSTDATGKVLFTGLSQGLYLVVGDTLKIGINSYFVEPFLIALPGMDQSGAWQYDVTSYPKIVDPEEGVPELYDLMVMKQWVDAGTTAKRPDQIDIALLRNGVVYDTHTLTSAENWRYTWTNLSNQYIWSAIETTRLADYTVKYQRSATTLVIVNTARSLTPGDDVPDKDIPQTGLLWWPIYALAVAGLVFFTIGWRQRYGNGGKHHAS